MRPEDYPPQEPLSAAGAAYAARCMARAVEPDLELAFGTDPAQRLAVFRAPEPSGDVLVFWHGGGWTNGYKEWMSFMAPALTARGVTFVAAGYRLAPAHAFPAGLVDCARALAMAQADCAHWGGDPARVFAGGHSAGGHWAALLAVAPALRTVEGAPVPLAGCLPVSGVYRFGEGSGLSQRPRFLGDDPASDAAASPVLRIDAAAAPPFLIAVGERDFPHLARQAREMHEALAAAGVDSTLLELPGRDHFDASLAAGEADGPWVAAAVDWMRTRPAAIDASTRRPAPTQAKRSTTGDSR